MKVLLLAAMLAMLHRGALFINPDELEGCDNDTLYGLTKPTAAKTCKNILEKNPTAGSAIYWLKPAFNPYQSYCDMTTEGGGWTLVSSYTFTNYKNFVLSSNAITPRPNWPASGGNVPVSTTPPLGENHFASLNFNLWKQFGHEFLIKSNINHWILCSEGSGSLVDWRAGSLNCRVVKAIPSVCPNSVPDAIKFSAYGPELYRTDPQKGAYYYLETSTAFDWPTHDPCGTNKPNQVTNVVLPFGSIFVRIPKKVPKVDGGFSAWGDWSECSKTCGEGTRTRRRTCSDPWPQGGGLDCSRLGASYKTQACELKACPAAEYGESQDNPAKSCQDILDHKLSADSGTYWIKINEKVIQVYCDQKTDSGGWTLVYSYTFTNYNNFGASNNAITPRPNWPSQGNVPVSTQAPTSETNYNAMDFNMWKKLGHEFMVKSNINHWIVCDDGAGSLVEWKAGAIECRVIKNVAHSCADNAPTQLKFYSGAPGLANSWVYYYFDDRTNGNWPTHDPCGKNQKNQLTGVVNPHGNIFIRPVKEVVTKFCDNILKENPGAGSGVYTLQYGDNEFKGYCDMKTEGGGWTLVLSYTFTNYNNFGAWNNAITPRPNWPSKGNVPVSTQAPTSETEYNAMAFKMWKKIGHEFMVKSNINHWIVCDDGIGSLVEWKAGAIECRVIKNVAHNCADNAPTQLKFYSGAPGLINSWTYYYFDDRTNGNWPTHDPCGKNQKNQLTGVVNPHGNIFIRPVKEVVTKFCHDILKENPGADSGVYTLQYGDNEFKGYCDMKTEGGGWTLVLSYTFTNYNYFGASNNAITPRPNWPSQGNVPVSTQAPTSETDYNAMPFKMWKKIGHEFMVKSNINHWIICNDGTGSLVEWKAGAVKCHVIKNVAHACVDNAPTHLKFYGGAPGLTDSWTYYYFDDRNNWYWPTHDPCGKNQKNQLTGVANPHGNIFIRGTAK